MGEARLMPRTILARCTTDSGVDSPDSDRNALATTLAPREIKKEKKIQTARAARADVAMLRKMMEKRIDTPNQNDT